MQTTHQVLHGMVTKGHYSRGGYMCNDLNFGRSRDDFTSDERAQAKQDITVYMIGMSGAMVNFFGLENLLASIKSKSLDDFRATEDYHDADAGCILSDYTRLLDNDYRDSNFTMWTVVAFCLDFNVETGNYDVDEDNKAHFDDFIADVIYSNWNARPMTVQSMRDAFNAFKDAENAKY